MPRPPQHEFAAALSWFARHEIRLAWREWLAMMTARPARAQARRRDRPDCLCRDHAPAGLCRDRPICADLQAPLDKSTLIVITATIFLAWALMLSQAIELVTRVFYARADLDLIMSSPVDARQHLFGADRRDRAVRDRDGAGAVDAVRRRPGDRRRGAMVRRLRRRHRHRPVGGGDRDRAHDHAVPSDRPEPDPAGGANSRRHHRRRLRDRAADRRHPVLRHAVALRGADLRRRGGVCARRRQHRLVAGARGARRRRSAAASAGRRPAAARRGDGDVLGAICRHRRAGLGQCRAGAAGRRRQQVSRRLAATGAAAQGILAAAARSVAGVADPDAAAVSGAAGADAVAEFFRQFHRHRADHAGHR